MAGFLRKVIEKSKTEVATLPVVAYYCSTSALLRFARVQSNMRLAPQYDTACCINWTSMSTFSSQLLCFTAKIRRTLEIESRVRRMQVIIFVLVLAAWKSYLEY